jgi:hypothetical protein
MRAKILVGAATFTLAATAGLGTTAPASAHDAQWNPGYVAADIAGSVVGGALAAATSPFWATDYYGSYGGTIPAMLTCQATSTSRVICPDKATLTRRDTATDIQRTAMDITVRTAGAIGTIAEARTLADLTLRGTLLVLAQFTRRPSRRHSDGGGFPGAFFHRAAAGVS